MRQYWWWIAASELKSFKLPFWILRLSRLAQITPQKKRLSILSASHLGSSREKAERIVNSTQAATKEGPAKKKKKTRQKILFFPGPGFLRIQKKKLFTRPSCLLSLSPVLPALGPYAMAMRQGKKRKKALSGCQFFPRFLSSQDQLGEIKNKIIIIPKKSGYSIHRTALGQAPLTPKRQKSPCSGKES